MELFEYYKGYGIRYYQSIGMAQVEDYGIIIYTSGGGIDSIDSCKDWIDKTN